MLIIVYVCQNKLATIVCPEVKSLNPDMRAF